MRLRSHWLLGLCAALLVTVPAWSRWLDPRLDLMDLHQVDDAKNHLLRLYHFGWLLDHGVWHPRWVPDMFMGYGYPLFNFYAPGTYYAGWLLRKLLGLDVWDSLRATGVLAALLMAAGTYSLAHALWRRAGLGLLAAIALLYGPYVLQINLFKRADIPETLALSLIPWLLLSTWRLWHSTTPGGRLAWLLAVAATGAGVVLTHNLTALTGCGLAGIWVLFLYVTKREWRNLGRVVAAGALAVGLSCFFWLPAIGDSKLVHIEELWGTGGLDYRGWFIEPSGNSPRQQDPKNRQTRTGLIDLNLRYPHQLVAPPKVSLAQVGLAGLAVVSLVLWPRRSVLLLPLLLASLACWSLTFAQSDPVWVRLPGMTLLQFPWRLFGPLGISIALAGAGSLAPLIAVLERRWDVRGRVAGWALTATVTAGVLFNSAGDWPKPFNDSPRRAIDANAAYADEKQDRAGVGTTTNKEFLPQAVQVATYTVGTSRTRGAFERLYPDADWLGDRLFPLAGDLRLIGFRSGPLWLSARVANDSPNDALLGLRQLSFPGWRAWLDGGRTALGTVPYVPEQQAGLGFMTVAIPPGEHTVNLAFGPTLLRLAALGVTLATLLDVTGLVVLIVWRRHTMPGIAAWPWARLGLAGGWALLAALMAAAAWREVRPAFGRFAVAPAPAAEQRSGVWLAGDLDRGGAGLVVNVAEAVRTGQAQVTSPSGVQLGQDRFVDVRQLTILDSDEERGAAGVSRREWLYLHPPSRVSVDVRVPAGRETWFQSALALDPSVWTAPLGDGVRFQALIAPLTGGSEGSPTLLLDKDVNPRADVGQRRWLPVAADLSPWGGSTVRLTLQTLPRDDQSFDWAGWGNPVVMVRDSARARASAVG
jgi:hypothetical protein